jgi:hypothetical protein
MSQAWRQNAAQLHGRNITPEKVPMALGFWRFILANRSRLSTLLRKPANKWASRLG